MMPASTHPTREQLQAWMDDRLDAQETAWIEEHLETCDDCAGKLDQLETDTDPLIHRLQTPTGEIALDDSQAESAGSTLSEPHDFAESNTTTNLLNFRERWQPQKLLAKGGIGEIWRGYDVLLGRQVAIKRLREDTRNHPNIVERFLREARITARVNHPGTVYMLDLVADGPNSYYVMSLVDGETLTHQIARLHNANRDDGELETSNLFPLLQAWISVAKTIAFAHLKGVLHRDIKSENVMIGEHGQVTVIDWGLAKSVSDSADRSDSETDYRRSLEETFGLARQTSPGTRLGTPAFMAPEQAIGDLDAIDERTDVYGLAAMLYEILTGQPPFAMRGLAAVLDAVAKSAPTPPATLTPGVPGELEALCLRGLSKNPKDRPQSAKEYANLVEHWLKEESARNQSRLARHQLFDLSADLMATLNLRMEVTWANTAWQTELGWDLDDLLGKTSLELVHPDDVDPSDRLIERSQNRETLKSVDRRILAGDGSYRWYSFSSSPIPGEDLVCVIGRDVADRMRRETEFSQLLDAAPDAMVVITNNQKIRHVNQQLLSLFGYEREELLFQPLELLLPERLRAKHVRHVAEHIVQPVFRPLKFDHPLLGRHKTGREISVAISLSFAKMEEEVLYAASLRVIDE